MIDARQQIIQKVIDALNEEINSLSLDVINIVQDTLILELNNYEVQERCTEIATYDDSAYSVLEKYLAVKRVEGKSPKTLNRYADELSKLFQFLGKNVKDITTYDLRFYIAWCGDNKRSKTKTIEFNTYQKPRKCSNRTLNGMRRCYSSFFGWALAEGIISSNPCAALAKINFKKQVKLPFSSEEMEKIKNSCKNDRDSALIHFLYSTGCRVSEVVNINVSDINMERKECVVLGKGNKERTVYLSDVCIMYLQQYLAHRKYDSEALFCGKCGARLGKTGMEALCKRIGEKANVKNVHPHRFRRTLATNLLDRGMNIQDVAAILGHADLKTTQVYCYISQSNVRNAYMKYAV